MTTVTFNDIRDAVSRAVATRGPNYIYPATIDDHGTRVCQYWNTETDTPDCIVAWVFHRLGATRAQFSDCEGSGATMVMRRLQEDGWNFGDEFERISFYLSNLQGLQDSGCTWGHASTIATGMDSDREVILDLAKENGILRQKHTELLDGINSERTD